MVIVVAALVGRSDADDVAPCDTVRSCIKACEAGKAGACDHLRKGFTAMCEQDVAEACAALGDMYWEGHASTPVSLPKGAKMYRKACELGEGRACNQWAFALAYGHGVTRDDARAVTIWRRGCELDHGLSCTTYGGRVWLGRGVERDYALAGEIFGKACRLKDPAGCTKLGVWHGEQGHDADARDAWQKGCALGDVEGCDRLVEIGDVPRTGAVDPVKVHAERVKQCEGGTPMACSHVADDYRHGRGVVANPAVADAIEVDTCERGYAPSCNIVGEARFEVGELPAADRYFTRACDLGMSSGCGHAGTVRRTRGKGHDRRSALAMFQLGCNASDPASCYGVGSAYESGVGVRRNRAKASTAYVRACDGGHAVACVAAAQLTSGAPAAALRDKACKAGHAASCPRPAAP